MTHKDHDPLIYENKKKWLNLITIATRNVKPKDIEILQTKETRPIVNKLY